MSTLVIDDLEENQELDRAAMEAVVGGSSLTSALAGDASKRPMQFAESPIVSGLILVDDIRRG